PKAPARRRSNMTLEQSIRRDFQGYAYYDKYLHTNHQFSLQGPLINTSRLLKVVKPGLLVLQNGTNGVIVWSSNTSQPMKNPVPKLSDSGNLVVTDVNNEDPRNFLWESFNYPTDTLLLGMKFGWNFKIGHEVRFYISLDPTGYPQRVLRKGSDVKFKSGPWNRLHYSGMPNLRVFPFYKYKVVLNKNEEHFTYELLSRSIISKVTLTKSGVSHCNIANSPICGCLDRFLPEDPDGWRRKNLSNGSIRRTPLNCTSEDVILKYSGIRLLDAVFQISHEYDTRRVQGGVLEELLLLERKEKKNIDNEFDIIHGNCSAKPELDVILLEEGEEYSEGKNR
ncbi:G-type lectin S-receptor-like serine/threonine-protein kinase At4g27290, partial [Olea europaea var. sylvestris]|uniref:G-type lectin S-receptor-like serine/threonine-protein kinase At4g27290 n=1 Tax=Olea europaea var. sylvestris TaxID=158386 RepID=UPI000C1CCD57